MDCFADMRFYGLVFKNIFFKLSVFGMLFVRLMFYRFNKRPFLFTHELLIDETGHLKSSVFHGESQTLEKLPHSKSGLLRTFSGFFFFILIGRCPVF